MLRDGKFQGYEISGLEMVVEETGEMIDLDFLKVVLYFASSR